MAAAEENSLELELPFGIILVVMGLFLSFALRDSLPFIVSAIVGGSAQVGVAYLNYRLKRVKK